MSFRFHIRQQWTLAVRRIDASTSMKVLWQPGEFAYLCSRHFRTDDYTHTTQRSRLKPSAVPSIFIHSPVAVISDRTRRYQQSYLILKAFHTPRVEQPLTHEAYKHKLFEYQNKLRNAGKREKRLRITVASMMKKLAATNLMNEELRERLDIFKGASVTFICDIIII